MTTSIRTFHPRRGRLSGRHHDALDRLWPAYGVTIEDGRGIPIDLSALFGRNAPRVLEIGSGMGDATADMAAEDTERDYLAVEVHTPGIANLLALAEARGLTNVRVARGDAIELLRHHLEPASLDAVNVFFPDPWPKLRHHKRRLIQPGHVDVVRSRLIPGGALRCATDSAAYAEHMLRTLTADDQLINAFDGFAPRPTYRPLTKFEQRGIDAGRSVFDLVFLRR